MSRPTTLRNVDEITTELRGQTQLACSGPYCSNVITQPPTGRPRLYRSGTCRQQAYAHRKYTAQRAAQLAAENNAIEEFRRALEELTKPQRVAVTRALFHAQQADLLTLGYRFRHEAIAQT